MTKINFARHFYAGRSKPVSAQKLVNLYAQDEPEDAKNIVSLIGTPGLKSYLTVGNGPIRGSIEMGGDLYVVSNSNVFKIDSLGVKTDLGAMNFVSGNVSIAENGTQVLIVNPSGDGYIATSSTLAIISDVDFPVASSVTYMDTYFIVSEKDTGKFFISAQNDGTAWAALDFTTAESDPDNIIIVKAYNDALWVFGQISIEVYYNSGNADFPFEAIQGGKIEKGCAAKLSVATENNILFWLGDDKVVYAASGYSPIPISNYAINKQIEDMVVINDAYGFIYSQEGHDFYILTFPTELLTFAYDITTKLWHQRQSFEEGRWLVNSFTSIFQKLIVGDFNSNNLYELDLDTYLDGSTTIQRIAVTAPLFAEGKRFITNRLRIDIEAGVGLTTGQGSDPKGMLEFSDDGGQTWSNERWVAIGKIGEYKNRLVWRRLGQSRERVYRLTISDPVKTVISGAYITSKLGIE
jgi:hypothetical protein